MAAKVLFRNKLFYFTLLLLLSCGEIPDRVIIGDPLLRKKQGKYYYNGERYNGVIESFDANNMKLNEAEVKNGLRDGTVKQWWGNGHLKMEADFSEGEYHGEVRSFYQDGALYSIFHYVHGHESGLQQMWTSDGRVKANYEVINGRKYGLTGVKNCVSVFEGDNIH